MSAGCETGETGGMGLTRNEWLLAVALALTFAPAGIATYLVGCLALIAIGRGMDPFAPARRPGQVWSGS